MFLLNLKLPGSREQGKPGVYVDGKKIASIGLKIKRGYSYHGLSLNIDMDLGPFKRINTCGYEELEVTQMKNYCNVSLNEVKKVIKKYIKNDLIIKGNMRESNFLIPTKTIKENGTIAIRNGIKPNKNSLVSSLRKPKWLRVTGS